MGETPTYEEFEQRIKTLAQQKLDRKIISEGVRHSEEGPADQFESKTGPKIHSPEVNLGSIINAEELQSIMDDFYHLTHMPTAVLDVKGNVIVATGWQDICTKFHRMNPETALNCAESDLFLAKNLKAGEYVAYQCKNGLWDVVTPLYVGTEHLGNIYTGQFFYDDEQIDEAFFIQQAEQYGFDEASYLEALRHVHRYSREAVDHSMRFLVKLATYISEISLGNMQLEREIRERKRAEASLEKELILRRILIEESRDGIVVMGQNGGVREANRQFAKMLGYSMAEITSLHVWDWDSHLSREHACA